MAKPKTLAELAQQTPTKGLTPLESELLVPYLGDQDIARTIPPPPASLERRQEKVLTKMRAFTESGSFDAKDLMGDQRDWYLGILQQRILEERLSHERDRRTAAESEVAETRKFWRIVAAGVLVACIAGALGWVAIELIRHAGG